MMSLPRRRLAGNKNNEGATSMNEFYYGVTGQDRKNLVTAISEILNIPKKYLGTPSYDFQVGDYTIDKNGTVIGAYDEELFAQLAERGFITLIEITEEADEPGTEIPDENTAQEIEPLTETENEATVEETAPEAETDSISITVPMNGFTPESLDNLCRMVLAKEPLIKKALGVDAIPIKVLPDGIEFLWFTSEHRENLMAYSQLISALCKTAKEKKRVTAKAQDSFENEKFTMRVWLIGLGLIGKEYGQIRKLMGENLSGNGAWRYGTPEKAVTEAASAPETADIAAGEAPADETPADAPAENETPSVAETAAD